MSPSRAPSGALAILCGAPSGGEYRILASIQRHLLSDVRCSAPSGKHLGYSLCARLLEGLLGGRHATGTFRAGRGLSGLLRKRGLLGGSVEGVLVRDGEGV